MNDREDRGLRRDFEDLGAELRREAPPFGSMWASADRERVNRPLWAGWLARRAALAGGLGVVALALFVTIRREGLPSDREALLIARSLSTWSAPSDSWMSRGAGASAGATPSGVPTLTIESIPLPTNGHAPAGASAGEAEEVVQ